MMIRTLILAIRRRSRRLARAVPSRRQSWRWLLPILLVFLFLSTLLWLPWQTQRMESADRQEQLIADTLWVEQTIRFQLGRNEENLRLLASEVASGYLSERRLRDRLQTMTRNNRELTRIAHFNAQDEVVLTTDHAALTVADYSFHSRTAWKLARETRAPRYSQPAPPPGLAGPMMLDYHVPIFSGGRYTGMLIASYSVGSILAEMVPWWFAQDNEVTVVDQDDGIIDRRAAGGPGRGVYTHRRALDLPGANLTLRTDSVKGEPRLLPGVLVGSVIALSIGLLWSLWALWRDINRRLAAEGALREQVAFRTAMENSLRTGLRARDLNGRITYVNPAFCEMVGIPAEDLVGTVPPMPYWAPEAMGEYQQRFSQVLAGSVTPQYETIFLRASGERFPVLIFESALVDDSGRQTGWMGSILDISDRKQVEDLNRRQQEKLEASARLATMGEIASTLAHELNQPLAAISSYTTGALNMLSSESGSARLDQLRAALEKAARQAQRAGQIIRSVHTFVKRREPTREPVTVDALFESVAPLVELQAAQFFVVIQAEIARGLPKVLADRVMVEQVLLNLTRNGIEAMQKAAPGRRVLRMVARRSRDCSGVVIEIIDRGHGIAPDIADRLFSPFFSTKAEGMGMGLKICRTAVEFHGGSLVHEDYPGGGTVFRFTLPAEGQPAVPAARDSGIIDSRDSAT